MKAREGVMKSAIYGDDLKKLYPVVEENMSDSGSLDNVLEFLVNAGQRSLPEVCLFIIFNEIKMTVNFIMSFSVKRRFN